MADAVDMGHSRQDQLAPPGKPGLGVGSDTADGDLEVGLGHLPVDHHRRAPTGFPTETQFS